MSIKTLTIHPTTGKVITTVAVTKSITKTLEMDLDKLMAKIVENSFFTTGILPIGGNTGLLMLRGGLGHLQIAYQVEPGVHTEIWGARERDAEASYVDLAQPYKLIVADFFNGKFSGARHFFSPVPFTSLDIPLYHVNLPNTNCKGYNGTGVGWMCLYHKEDTSEMTIGEKIAYVYRRASGSEAYNDANMSETDGPRFFKGRDMPSYTWDMQAWAAKTKAEGFAWASLTENMVPILVKSMDEQDRGDILGGHHLTFGDAINGSYYSYYPHKGFDTQPIKPIAAKERGLDEVLAPLITTARQTLLNYAHSSSTEIDAPADLDGILSVLKELRVGFTPFVPSFNCAGCSKWFPLEVAIMAYAGEDTEIEYCSDCVNGGTHTVSIDRYFFDPDVTDVDSQGMLVTRDNIIVVYGWGRRPYVNSFPKWLATENCPSCATPLSPLDMSRPLANNRVYDHNNEVVGCLNCKTHVWCRPINKWIHKTPSMAKDRGMVKLKASSSAHYPFMHDEAGEWANNQSYEFKTVPENYLAEGSGFFNCACDFVCSKARMTDVVGGDGRRACDTCVSEGAYSPISTRIQPPTVDQTTPVPTAKSKKTDQPSATAELSGEMLNLFLDT